MFSQQCFKLHNKKKTASEKKEREREQWTVKLQQAEGTSNKLKQFTG